MEEKNLQIRVLYSKYRNFRKIGNYSFISAPVFKPCQPSHIDLFYDDKRNKKLVFQPPIQPYYKIPGKLCNDELFQISVIRNKHKTWEFSPVDSIIHELNRDDIAEYEVDKSDNEPFFVIHTHTIYPNGESYCSHRIISEYLLIKFLKKYYKDIKIKNLIKLLVFCKKEEILGVSSFIEELPVEIKLLMEIQ